MALSNYTELQASIASWLDRDDLTTQIPDFIKLAESRLNRRLRLRDKESEESLSLSSAASSVALPDGYVAPVALWLVKSDGRKKLTFRTPGEIGLLTAAGEPEEWTIIGDNIVFERPANAAYSLIFTMLGSFALSDASPTNWLLTNHPDAYLYAAQLEAELYMRNPEDAASFAALLEQSLSEIERKELRSKKLASLRVETQFQPRRADYADEIET